MSESIHEKLVKLTSAHVGIGEDLVTSDAKLFDDLGFDSFDLVEISMEIEDEFDIHIPADDMDAWQTFGDMAATVEKGIAAKASK